MCAACWVGTGTQLKWDHMSILSLDWNLFEIQGNSTTSYLKNVKPQVTQNLKMKISQGSHFLKKHDSELQCHISSFLFTIHVSLSIYIVLSIYCDKTSYNWLQLVFKWFLNIFKLRQLAIQPSLKLSNHNWWFVCIQLGSVGFWSFFQFRQPDL
jgi:hypothetical protein